MRSAPSGLLFVLLVVFTLFASASGAPAQEPKDDAPGDSLEAFPKSLFFVMPPRKRPQPDVAQSLLVVLPGGDATREFLPFVRDTIHGTVPDDCVTVCVTAVKWRPDQVVIWPTARNKVPGMQYTTEDYVRAVYDEVGKRYRIDPERVLLLAWSSGGPPAYELLLAKETPFRRGFVAMAIWPYPDTDEAKDRRFFLHQSPEDDRTKFEHVKLAVPALQKAGAQVQLSVYKGGHGWHGDYPTRMRKAWKWLLSDEPAPKPEWPDEKKGAKPKTAAKKGGKGANLLTNGGFEQGLEGWRETDNSGRLEVAATKAEKSEGKQSLHLKKEGGMPLDLVVQEIEALPAASSITVSAQVKAKAAGNCFVKVWVYPKGNDEPRHADVDLVQVRGDRDFERAEKTWDAEEGDRVVVQVVMVLGGEVWLDDVVVSASK